MSKTKIKRGGRRKPTSAKAETTKYSMLLAYDVPCYGTIEFTSKSDTAAVRKAKRMLNDWDRHVGNVVFKEEHGGADMHRIVHVTHQATQRNVVEDLYLSETPCPKVLIHVHGGVATYEIAGGPVDCVLVDEDNIDAGDPPVELDESWKVLTIGRFLQKGSKYVRFVKR